MFAGIAADRDDEIFIAGQIDSDRIVCWSYPQTVHPSKNGPVDSGRVYVVFENGGPQDHPVVGWDLDFDADPRGVFSDRAGAESFAAKIADSVLSVHIWEVEIGWFDRRLVTERGV
ncbi:hypothetical protein [Gordonia shandongensis]|uniref:hypothetical protein n=1 Tax=Gordonia shandongensis TaxID=376351 RepID=UPI0012EBED13|nr:hypothetical protein [Gordonia shandongensis]